jgi:hypothetical protein
MDLLSIKEREGLNLTSNQIRGEQMMRRESERRSSTQTSRQTITERDNRQTQNKAETRSRERD